MMNGIEEFQYHQYLYEKETRMNPNKLISDFNPDSGTTKLLQHLENAFVIPAPCILSQDKIVKVRDIYDLIDFDDNGGINIHNVQFWTAYQNGFTVTIVVLELKSGELLKRSHRLNNDSIPCDWALIEFDFLNRMPDSKEQLLFDSRDPD